jgi:glycosyltransferase involved in cell wall biosynthesis
MYYDRELLDLFKTFVEEVPGKNPHFMILTGTEEEKVHRWAEASGVEKERVIVKELPPEEVPQHLSAADIAFSGVRQTPSKAYCSPIKHGEYWGCGLPIMVMRGVSEDDLVVEKERSGVVIEEATEESYRKAVGDMVELLQKGEEKLRRICRGTAKRERSLKKAASLLKERMERRIEASKRAVGAR